MRRLYGLLSLIGTLTLLGSLLAYVRNASITSVFGLSGESDAYFVALFIPTTLQAILVLSALAPALVHVYVNYTEQGKNDDARVAFSTVVNVAAIAISALVLLGMLMSGFLVRAIAPGLSAESAALATRLMYFTLPLLLLLCIASLLGPILNTREHFLTPALNPVVINAFAIASIIVGGKTIGITAAGAGLLAGGAAHVALLVFLIRRKGIAYSFTLRLGHPGARRALIQSAPVAAYMAVAYSAIIIERLIASTKGPGAISMLAIAMTIFSLPTTTFNGSLGVILYPRFVRFAAMARAELAASMMQAARLTLVVLVPATMLIIAARGPLMRLAYGPGEVSSHDVATGGGVLAAYVLAMSAVGVTQLLQKGIYAGGDFVTPLRVESLTIGVYAALALGLSSVWSVVGLAAARACQHFLNMMITFWMVRRVGGVPSLRTLALFAVRPLIGGAAAVAFYSVASMVIGRVYPPPSYLPLAAEQSVLLVMSGGVYLLGASALGIAEIRALWRLSASGRQGPVITQEAA
jgi:putative peptidoglycan lipid II flippase